MSFCMSCGTKLQPQWHFCANCRQPIEDGGQQQGSTEIPVAEPSLQAPTHREGPAADAPLPPSGAGPITETGATAITETGNRNQAAHTPAGVGAGLAATGGGSSDNGGGGFNNGSGGPGGGPGPHGPAGSDSSEPGRKTNRKAIVLGAIAVVVVALGVGAFLFVQNLVRGGAGSPEQVAEKIMDSIESKDGVGLATMVAPAERESLDRLREGVTEKIEEFGIVDAANKVGENSGEIDSEINLDGITVSFENVVPTVTEVDDQLAILNVTSGTVRVQVDPEQTTGAVRSGLESADKMDAVDETTDLSELGVDGEGVKIAVVKDNGRWYVSTLYTGLEMVTQSSGSQRGTLPEPTDGAKSPAEAAQALMAAVPGIMDSGKFTDLGNYFASYEGNAVHYYGGSLDNAMEGGTGSSLKIASNTFKDADKDGNRGRALVEELKMEMDGSAVTLTADCIDANSEKICRGKSGYVMSPGGSGPDSLVSALPQLGLSSIKEDGTWKVSLMDTVTDWTLEWMDSITREQALAMMDLARSEDPAGTLTVGEEADLKFNSAGYAVMAVKLDADTALEAKGDNDISKFSVYSKDGKEKITTSSYSADEIPAGEYKVVLFAGQDWADKFAEEGNGVQYSGPATLSEFTAPPMIDGDNYEQYNYLTLDEYPGPTKSHVLDVPEGASTELLVTTEGFAGAWNKPGSLVLTLGGKTYKVPVGNGSEKLVIPVSAGQAQVLKVELQKGEGTGNEVDYTLELSAK